MNKSDNNNTTSPQEKTENFSSSPFKENRDAVSTGSRSTARPSSLRKFANSEPEDINHQNIKNQDKTQIKEDTGPKEETNTESFDHKNIEKSSFQDIEEAHASRDEQLSEIQGLKEKLTLLEEEKFSIQVQLEKVSKSLKAATLEIKNINHQHELETKQVQKSIKKTIASEILQVFNTFYLALQHKPVNLEDLEKFLTTINSSLTKSLDDLKKIGLEIVFPNIGSQIDLSFMNVVNPSPGSEIETLTVKQVVSPALIIDLQVIQPASVMV